MTAFPSDILSLIVATPHALDHAEITSQLLARSGKDQLWGRLPLTPHNVAATCGSSIVLQAGAGLD